MLRRHPLALALLLAAVLAAPSLWLSRFGDDYPQLLALEGSTSPFRGMFSRFDLFVFSDGDPAHVRALMDRGALFWWVHPSLKITFFRPLSSALMVVDHALFGRGEVGPHLHSALWYLALVGAAGLLLRRAFLSAVGVTALLLFAIDGAHSLPVMWLANRNALVAASFGFLAVFFHLRSREGGPGGSRAVSLVLFAVALLAGESALGTVAYVVAYEATRTDDALGRRALALVPVGALCVAWALAYKLLGYGAAGALMYIDPLGQPLDFLGAVLSRGPVLLAAAFPGVWADLWNVVPPEKRAGLIAASAAASGVFATALWRAARSFEPAERRRVFWMCLSAALSILPVAATFPSDRLLLVPSLGAAAVVAALIHHAWQARGRSLAGVAWAAGAAVLVLLHVVLALPQWAFGGALMHLAGKKSDRMNRSVLAAVDGAKLADLRLVTLWSDPLSALNAGARLSLETSSAPRAWWLLSIAPGDHVFTRAGPATLEMALAAPERRLLASEAELFLRAPPTPMPDREQLPGLGIDVAERDAAGVVRLRFTFDVPLEDPSLVFLHWRDGELVRLAPPPVGTRWVEKQPPLM